MTTLFAAREALRELKAIENTYNSQILVTRLQIIAAYLEAQKPPFDIGAHIPGEPINAQKFHELYGQKHIELIPFEDVKFDPFDPRTLKLTGTVAIKDPKVIAAIRDGLKADAGLVFKPAEGDANA